VNLSPPVTEPYPAAPAYLLEGDFNGDGIPDFAFTANGGATGTLLGNGDGTFRVVNTGSVMGTVAADFNGDGKLDLAAQFGPDLAVWLGNGDGTFQGSTLSVGSSNFVTDLATADVNRDGIPDLIAVDSSGFADVSLGIGNGFFQNAASYAAGPNPAALAVGDLNGDGIADIVAGNAPSGGPGTVSVLLGNAAGGFGAPQSFATDLSPAALIIADFNGDGHPDIAVAHPSRNTVSILIGNGDGTFQPATILALPGGPTKLFAADLNGDGRVDVIAFYSDLYTARTTTAAFSVLVGRGDGTFSGPVDYIDSRIPSDLAVADVNGDGRLDVIFDWAGANLTQFGLDVFLGTPPARLRPCPDGRLTPQSACRAF
jgi:hypothetical protein